MGILSTGSTATLSFSSMQDNGFDSQPRDWHDNGQCPGDDHDDHGIDTYDDMLKHFRKHLDDIL